MSQTAISQSPITQTPTGRTPPGRTPTSQNPTSQNPVALPSVALPSVGRSDVHRPDPFVDQAGDPVDQPDGFVEVPDDFDDEQSLLVQWMIFILQTVVGAAVGLSLWLGFYQLWSKWPFYAAPAVGVVMAGMVLIARTVRRRYGYELDVMTALLTVGVGVILTVLPAAFTVQGVS